MAESKAKADILPEEINRLLLKYLQSIEFGSVTLTIQNGRVVQIEGSEKIRIDKK